jgi:hypothetical protein
MKLYSWDDEVIEVQSMHPYGIQVLIKGKEQAVVRPYDSISCSDPTIEDGVLPYKKALKDIKKARRLVKDRKSVV